LQSEQHQRRKAIGLLGIPLLLVFLGLWAMNAFNLSFILHPRGTGQILIFSGLSVVVFLVLLALLILLLRNILKLYADQRSRVLGSRLRTRMVLTAVLLSFAPAVFMFLFSYQLMNRSIERWFSQPPRDLLADSATIALQTAAYATANARAEAEALVASEALNRAIESQDNSAVLEALHSRKITLEGGFAVVFGEDGSTLARYQLPPGTGAVAVRPWLDEQTNNQLSGPSKPFPANLLPAAQRSDEPIVRIGTDEYALGLASGVQKVMVVVGLPMPAGLSKTISHIRTNADQYWTLYRSRNRIRSTYLMMLLLLTVLVFFTSSWLALFLSKQITRPVEALADAMGEIAAGHYQHRVNLESSEELAELIHSFNRMASDLEESRKLADYSAIQLSAANRTLEERRRELETILETIPNGVLTLDPQTRVLQANRAFFDLMRHHVESDLSGLPLEALFPEEMAKDLQRLIRRSQRMGLATANFEMTGPEGPLHLSATMSLLELEHGQRGSILVLEDTTETLHAQRQAAWKEVAQRVAHEIKNPLTPISLSAERILRHIDRSTPDSPGIIRKCSEVILGSVETLRTLVDQFAALAQFPTAQPRPSNVNEIVESALLLFSGRLENIRIDKRLEPGLPLVMADCEAMKRALANLIDNAAEAMQGTHLRVLTIETDLNESHDSVEIAVSDTGHGLTDEMRERLFLPFFSTKQRGTGLGLSIAAKIVQEHQGTIRAEKNSPAGTRFILALPLAENTSNWTNGMSDIKEPALPRENGDRA
jgi:two-component system, NtrC family, nitrogen regulation sensor histidine kinase NtrY